MFFQVFWGKNMKNMKKMLNMKLFYVLLYLKKYHNNKSKKYVYYSKQFFIEDSFWFILKSHNQFSISKKRKKGAAEPYFLDWFHS